MKKQCLLCSHQNFRKISSTVRDSLEHKILQCKKCGHFQLYPIPTQKDDRNFYDKNLQEKNLNYFLELNEIKKNSSNDTLRRVNFIKKNIKKNDKVLEIGSGYGFFLESMNKLGYKIMGIEISKERRKLLKKVTKVKILDIDLNNEIFHTQNFDVIILFHVLEHIIEPINFLKKLKSILSKRGKIIVEVPNVDDLQLTSNKKYKELFWQRAHIHYFNPKTLKFVFKSAKLNTKIFGVQRYSIENMINWKLTNKPQLASPSFYSSKEYNWIDKFYKTTLEKSLKCDTIIALAKIR